MPAASSIVLSSRSLRLITVRNRNRSIRRAEDRRASPPRRCSATTNGRCQLAVDRVGDEAAEHVHLAVREIEHVHQREDQRQAERDQRVLRAEIEPVDDDLFHPLSPRSSARPRAASGELIRREARRASVGFAGRFTRQVGLQSTSATNSVLNLPSLYSLTTSGTASWRFWPNEVVPT